jgi:N-glycosylase/DNA lyase
MTQHCTLHTYTGKMTLELPPAATEVMKGVQWGDVRINATPAQRVKDMFTTRLHEPFVQVHERHTLPQIVGNLLIEQADDAPVRLVNEAAYVHLDAVGAFGPTAPTASQLLEWLKDPVPLRNQVKQIYCLSQTKAEILSGALTALVNIPDLEDERALRNWLSTIPGLDYTKASWAVKYFKEPDNIAIIDAYTLQNGQLMGLFSLDSSIQHDYLALEKALIEFCSYLNVTPWEFSWSLLQDSWEDQTDVVQRVESLKQAKTAAHSAAVRTLRASKGTAAKRSLSKKVRLATET